jgi:hypothetical protein
LIADRAGLLLADLGLEQIANDALGFVLAFDGGDTINRLLGLAGLAFSGQVRAYCADCTLRMTPL